jgi:hypothetical protein
MCGRWKNNWLYKLSPEHCGLFPVNMSVLVIDCVQVKFGYSCRELVPRVLLSYIAELYKPVPRWTCEKGLINHERLHPILHCVSRYGYGYLLSAALSRHYNCSYRRIVMGYANCRNFRMFYIAHKVTNREHLAWSQCWKGPTLVLPFKASHLSTHQCRYSLGKMEQRAVCHPGDSIRFYGLFENILKRIHILVDSRVWWVSGALADPTTETRVDVMEISELGPKQIS